MNKLQLSHQCMFWFLTDNNYIMKNKEERKYILEAIRLAKLKENGESIPMCSIIEILKQADDVVKNLNLDFVSVAKRKVCSLGVDYEKCSEHPLNEIGCLSCEKYKEQTSR